MADAAMLSKANMQQLDADGYRKIVGARLASTAARFIEQIHTEFPRADHAIRRFA